MPVKYKGVLGLLKNRLRFLLQAAGCRLQAEVNECERSSWDIEEHCEMKPSKIRNNAANIKQLATAGCLLADLAAGLYRIK